MGKVHFGRIKKAAIKGMDSQPLKDQAYKILSDRVEQAKQHMLNEFRAHPITKEIESGPRSENSSRTLGGYGNLFSFIGFAASSDPISVVDRYLRDKPKVYKSSKFKRKSSAAFLTFRIEVPVVDKVEELTPSPWGGRSWSRSIERGMSGLGYYLHSREKTLKNSRSGSGVQVDEKLRSLAFRPVKYMSSILNGFYKEIKLR